VDYKELLEKYNLSPHCVSNIPIGWIPMVDKLIQNLFDLGWDGNLNQIKAKFGRLRFYLNSENESPEIKAKIHEAEIKSAETCENCSGFVKISNEPVHSEHRAIMRAFCIKCMRDAYKL
jgi:hypothetical protein